MECGWSVVYIRIWDVCSVGGVLSVGRMGCDQQVCTYYTLDQLVYRVLAMAMHAVLPPIWLVPIPKGVCALCPVMCHVCG